MIEENTGVYKMLQEIPYTDEFDQTNEYFGKTKQEVISIILDRVRQAYSLFNFQTYKMTEPEDKMPMETYILFADTKLVVIG